MDYFIRDSLIRLESKGEELALLCYPAGESDQSRVNIRSDRGEWFVASGDPKEWSVMDAKTNLNLASFRYTDSDAGDLELATGRIYKWAQSNEGAGWRKTTLKNASIIEYESISSELGHVQIVDVRLMQAPALSLLVLFGLHLFVGTSFVRASL